MMGRFDDALYAYDAAIAEHQENIVAKIGRAETLRQMGRLDEALYAYESVIAEHPDDVVAKSGRAETLKAMGRLDEALVAYESIIAAHPESIVTKIGRAEILKAIGRLDEALVAYQYTIAEHPKNVVAKNGYAETLKEMGRLDEALYTYQVTIAEYPDDIVAKIGRAGTLRDMGQQERSYYQVPSQDSQRKLIHPSQLIHQLGNDQNSKLKGYKYQIALSFAGEDRKIAKELADLLSAKGLNVFYDEYEQADLWGKDLYQHLQHVYGDAAKFCVIFLSKSYANKLWTRHELKQAQARAFRENEEYILPIRIDDTEIPGISETVGYLDMRKFSLEDIAIMLVAKLQLDVGGVR